MPFARREDDFSGVRSPAHRIEDDDAIVAASRRKLRLAAEETFRVKGRWRGDPLQPAAVAAISVE